MYIYIYTHSSYIVYICFAYRDDAYQTYHKPMTEKKTYHKPIKPTTNL